MLLVNVEGRLCQIISPQKINFRLKIMLIMPKILRSLLLKSLCSLSAMNEFAKRIGTNLCAICWESKSVRNLQICAIIVRQLKLVILINSVQSEDCANFVLFLYTRAQYGNVLSLFFFSSPVWPQCVRKWLRRVRT